MIRGYDVFYDVFMIVCIISVNINKEIRISSY